MFDFALIWDRWCLFISFPQVDSDHFSKFLPGFEQRKIKEERKETSKKERKKKLYALGFFNLFWLAQLS